MDFKAQRITVGHRCLAELVGQVGQKWGVPEMGIYQIGWFIMEKNIYMMEKPIKNVFLNGTSHKQMDDSGILVDLSIMLLKKKLITGGHRIVLIGAVPHLIFQPWSRPVKKTLGCASGDLNRPFQKFTRWCPIVS